MSTNIVHKSENSWQHKSEIELEYGKLQAVLEWCNDNVKNNWNFSPSTTANIQLHGNMHTWIFMFSSEDDYIKFLLSKR